MYSRVPVWLYVITGVIMGADVPINLSSHHALKEYLQLLSGHRAFIF
jgi:hypothetical protein